MKLSATTLLACLGLLLVASGCKNKNEDRAWYAAKSLNTEESFAGYLSKYPEGKYAEEARAGLEKSVATEALQYRDVFKLWAYLERYPKGQYAQKARKTMLSEARNHAGDLSLEQLAAARVEIETSLGSFKFSFYPEAAPNHARNLIALAYAGFYKGLVVNRVQADSMVLMGDPMGDGLGGPGYMIEMEPNDLKHLRGRVSMWRLPIDPDTAGSQFFVCLRDVPEFDGRFTVFGEVTDGLETLEKISRVPTQEREGRPTTFPLSPIRIVETRVLGIDMDRIIREAYEERKAIQSELFQVGEDLEQGDSLAEY